MNNNYERIKHLPPLSQNNAREIARRWMAKMEKWPSESQAQRLEDIGITCDFTNKDHGIGPEDMK